MTKNERDFERAWAEAEKRFEAEVADRRYCTECDLLRACARHADRMENAKRNMGPWPPFVVVPPKPIR